MLGVRVPFLSRPSYRIQLWSSALDGIFMAALLQVSFLLAKDLEAPRWAVMLGASLTAFPMVMTPVLPWYFGFELLNLAGSYPAGIH